MKDELERGTVVAAPARGRRGRLRPYVDAWLLSFFLGAALVVLWALGDDAAGSGIHPLGGFLVAPFLALLSAPALWLSRLFPEHSPSSAVRLIRRTVIGALCGLFPAALLAALSTRPDDAGSRGSAGGLWLCGLLFGLIAGLVDSLHLDGATRADEEAGSPQAADDPGRGSA